MKAAVLRFPGHVSPLRQWLLGCSSMRESVFSVLALVLALAAATAAAALSLGLKEQIETARAALHAQRGASSGKDAARATSLPLLTAPQAVAWNRMVRQLNTPWSALLDALESATPEDVAVVAIEPDARQGTIRLLVEARTLDMLLVYAGTLRALEQFDSVNLVKHETNDQDQNRPLRLSLDIRFKDRSVAQPAPAPVSRRAGL